MTNNSNVTYLEGNMFTTTMPAVGHGVNIHGVMGSGIAVTVKKLYPDIFPLYREACLNGSLQAGNMLPLYSSIQHKWVLNLASQDKPGRNAHLDWVRSSTHLAFQFCIQQELTGFALPRIGAGVGGLNWTDVDKVLNEVASEYPKVQLEIWSLPGA